jgi:hypothetical protein
MNREMKAQTKEATTDCACGSKPAQTLKRNPFKTKIKGFNLKIQ